MKNHVIYEEAVDCYDSSNGLDKAFGKDLDLINIYYCDLKTPFFKLQFAQLLM